MPPLETLSTICGWIYTISWSASFYPQPILNYRRKSTTGTTIDFPTINVLGFFAYFASSAAFLYSPIIREQYALRHHGLTPTVELNDLAFAGHAVVLSVITYTQFWPRVWGFDKHVERGSEGRASWPMWGVYLVSVLGVGVVCILVRRAGDDPRTDWAWLDAVYALSYIKILVTTVKYMPQVLTNYRNKSTVGWSIEQILCDFTGGVLSLVQLGIDAYLQHDWSGVTGNPVKLALGNLAVFYDIIFFIQHWWLYRDSNGSKTVEDEEDGPEEEEPLLQNER